MKRGKCASFEDDTSESLVEAEVAELAELIDA